jgi:hypothetical protein
VVGVDGPAVLRERMELLGVTPAGTGSAGGSCRLLPAADGTWVAMNLARRDDVELLAAWMEHPWDGPPWDAVRDAVATRPGRVAVDRAQLLGLPAAVAVPPPTGRSPRTLPGGVRARDARRLVDLSSLWAGPLCARLLADAAGLSVVKVEDERRPDGARAGPPRFWDRLNHDKEHRSLDLAAPAGRARLGRLVADADVVVTSGRPRALAGLGLDPAAHAAAGGVWVAITGYGLDGPERDWVAFGDDAAVAGGAAVAAGGPDAPVFVLDAVADPLAGLHGAAAALDALGAEHGTVLDVALRDVVAAALTDPQYAG